MREALAVQAFEEGLKVVNLIDHPSEYAMLQNNLGNALQYASSSHALENNLRALDAYDEALKVRTRETTPLEYANTISNKANCLWNLPDDPDHPEAGNRTNLTQAQRLLPRGARDLHGTWRPREGADRRRSRRSDSARDIVVAGDQRPRRPRRRSSRETLTGWRLEQWSISLQRRPLLLSSSA